MFRSSHPWCYLPKFIADFFLYKYAPLLILGIAVILQYNLFVTPEKLEQTHREILSEVSKAYITKSEFVLVKEQLTDINKKIDKIYDTLIKERR
jgi:hypothetical protein